MILGQKSQKVKNIFLSYYSFDFYGQKKYSAIADTVFLLPCRKTGYSPLKSALRFSMNAFMPSF